jgi:hypothetical protein
MATNKKRINLNVLITCILIAAFLLISGCVDSEEEATTT